MPKKWQNLLKKECPNCGTSLLERKQFLECPNPNPENKYQACFFIKKTEAAAILLDPSHSAHRYLPEESKATLQKFGLMA